MISAIVLAAGLSTRMGKPKINLPWGSETVLVRILTVLDRSGIDEIIVVVGATEPTSLPDALSKKIKIIHNDFADKTGMLSSLKIGMGILNPDSIAYLVVLGDQPQIQTEVIRQMLAEYHKVKPSLLIPSFQMHRGHPWIISRILWGDILAMGATSNLRDFINKHKSMIHYVGVNTDSVLKDLDTPEEYMTELLAFDETPKKNLRTE